MHAHPDVGGLGHDTYSSQHVLPRGMQPSPHSIWKSPQLKDWRGSSAEASERTSGVLCMRFMTAPPRRAWAVASPTRIVGGFCNREQVGSDIFLGMVGMGRERTGGGEGPRKRKTDRT